MVDGKIRNPNHITDTRALMFLRNSFPPEWISRDVSPDYGIDMDLELFGYENDKCVTLGEHVFLQVKGTDHATYSRIQLFGKKEDPQLDTTIDVLKFQIDVPFLNLVERMGSGMPVLLTVVDLQKQQAYYICLNDYIRYVLPLQNPDYKNQGSVTIYIPIENTISQWAFLWYGKRSKLYSLFQEIHAVDDSCHYKDGEDLIATVRALLERIQHHDAWKARDSFGYMDVQHQMLTEMCENDLITREAKAFVTACVKDDDNWQEAIIYADLDERPTRGYVFAQETSCRRFLECASGMAGYFNDCIRQFGLPTTTSLILK